MADCTPQALVTDSKCVFAALSERQLLASIAFNLATIAGASTDPAALSASSKCLFTAFSEKQLLAIIVYLQCQLNGG